MRLRRKDRRIRVGLLRLRHRLYGRLRIHVGLLRFLHRLRKRLRVHFSPPHTFSRHILPVISISLLFLMILILLIFLVLLIFMSFSFTRFFMLCPIFKCNLIKGNTVYIRTDTSCRNLFDLIFTDKIYAPFLCLLGNHLRFSGFHLNFYRGLLLMLIPSTAA